ncbi:ankyrin repeat domain-containing protein 37 [Gastrophryne carolinensis]
MCLVFEYVPGGVACVRWNDKSAEWWLYTELSLAACGVVGDRMLRLLHTGEEDASLSQLLESGCEVNSPQDALGQTPAHLAAGEGHALFLLWQLQSGSEINKQDLFGETLIHKAARSGSLECLSVLIAHDARLDVYNRDGYTAEDLALSSGFFECAKYLATVKQTQDTFSRARSSMQDFKETEAALKRAHSSLAVTHGKRRRSDGKRVFLNTCLTKSRLLQDLIAVRELKDQPMDFHYIQMFFCPLWA